MTIKNTSDHPIRDRIGDFETNLDAIMSTYFNVLQLKSGEVVTIGIPWRAVTGSVLFAFGAVGRQWYGSWTDMEVYYYMRRTGKDDVAKEILDAQLNYIMTPEYNMAERYADHDPYYMPWCPNCSANGRTISMLCDWYIDRPDHKMYI